MADNNFLSWLDSECKNLEALSGRKVAELLYAKLIARYETGNIYLVKILSGKIVSKFSLFFDGR